MIAHSHGGDALYALRERGDGDETRLADVKVTALATPFLAMRKRRLPTYLLVMLGV